MKARWTVQQTQKAIKALKKKRKHLLTITNAEEVATVITNQRAVIYRTNPFYHTLEIEWEKPLLILSWEAADELVKQIKKGMEFHEREKRRELELRRLKEWNEQCAIQ